jgi:hypothetical protein
MCIHFIAFKICCIVSTGTLLCGEKALRLSTKGLETFLLLESASINIIKIRKFMTIYIVLIFAMLPWLMSPFMLITILSTHDFLQYFYIS